MPPNTSTEKNERTIWYNVILQSWIAWSMLIAYVTVNIVGGHSAVTSYWLGGLALGVILLGMNGLARTEILWWGKSNSWFRTHPFARLLHHIHNEGELAGIAIATIVLFFQLMRGEHPHFAFIEAFTLLGIMSAANLSVRQMMPIMATVERLFGKWGAIVVGSILSSLTGEPAAAVFLSEYFKHRTSAENRVRIATGLGATIGSGGGLMPFSAPPILIVWAILQSTFGWNLADLLLLVGGGCVLHVAVVAWKMRGLIASSSDAHPAKITNALPLLTLAVTIAVNVTYGLHGMTELIWMWNSVVATWALATAIKKPELIESEGKEQHGHGRHWQPLTLAVLLLGLEIVGTEAEPLLSFLAGFIPQNAPVLLVALMLWYATAFTSHFADNALASRIFITVAVTLSGSIGHADLMALSVVLGALFGGFLLIPANLPNFAIAAEFRVTSGEWARTAWKWYWSGIMHILWITGWFFLG